MSGQDFQQAERPQAFTGKSAGTNNVISMADYIVRSGRAAERFFLRRLRYEGNRENVVVFMSDYRPATNFHD